MLRGRAGLTPLLRSSLASEPKLNSDTSNSCNFLTFQSLKKMSSISSLISSLIYVPPHMSAVQALFVYSLIAFLALALLGTLYTLYLLVKYRDRALFCRSNAERPDVPTITEGLAPVLGNLPYLTANSKHTIQTHLELAKKYGPVWV